MTTETLPTPQTAAPTRFHFSLNVSNLPRAVTFFEQLLGVPAAKQRDDYAKFELDSPPLVFSLTPRPPGEHGSFNHAGFRFADSAALVEAQRRLEAAGISTQREEGVECCYARQTKFWVHDFDQRLWEFYVLEGDIDHRGEGQTLEDMVGLDAIPGADEPIVYEHRMGSPLELPDKRCDEIRLRGTFNVPVEEAFVNDTLQQAFAALKPGGRIELHMLTCEQPISGELSLPGSAAKVKHLPVRTELMRALEDAGFIDLALTTFRSTACFELAGHPLRETRIAATRPSMKSDTVCTVVYKGPFRQITDDEGHTWQRGQPATISQSRWQTLSDSPVAEMFTLMPESAPVGSCGG